MLSIKKIKCLVIDDELPARDILEKHIADVEALELTGTCTNAVEALSFLQSNTVDLLFLDIPDLGRQLYSFFLQFPLNG